MPHETDQPARSLELAREQSLTELEQLAGDRDQARIDQEQFNLDAQRQDDAGAAGRLAPILDDRQARIDREQLTRDVGQQALDHAQEGRDNQQEALNETRATLSLPTSEQPDVADASMVRRGAIERAQAARERANTALTRAQAAMVRTQAAETRAREGAPSKTG